MTQLKQSFIKRTIDIRVYNHVLECCLTFEVACLTISNVCLTISCARLTLNARCLAFGAARLTISSACSTFPRYSFSFHADLIRITRYASVSVGNVLLLTLADHEYCIFSYYISLLFVFLIYLKHINCFCISSFLRFYDYSSLILIPFIFITISAFSSV